MKRVMVRRTALVMLCIMLASVQLAAEEWRTGRNTPEGTAQTPQLRTLEERPVRSVALYQTGKAVERFTWHGATPDPLLIDGLHQELTQYYIKQYSSPGGLQWLKAAMSRAAPFITHIRSEVEQRGLPPELVYLPVIESTYVPHAVSRSGAAGLWQFMKNSIAPFDIHVDEWMDERRDFWKATDGALRKLKENYDYFGDWPLALAAYNAGLGALSRSVSSSGIKDYWILCERKLLKSETIHYVPKFLAVSHILSRAGRYGLDLEWPESIEWTRIALERSIDLDLLAQNAGIDAELLHLANSELYYAITPPGTSYYLKVRRQDVAAVNESLARDDIELLHYHLHTIAYGDTLSALARHYEVSVNQIMDANEDLHPRYLQLGQRILVPALKKDISPYQRQRNPGADLRFDGSHLVKRGETLWSISLAYQIDPELLAEKNGMTLNSILREGSLLKTPVLRAEAY